VSVKTRVEQYASYHIDIKRRKPSTLQGTFGGVIDRIAARHGQPEARRFKAQVREVMEVTQRGWVRRYAAHRSARCDRKVPFQVEWLTIADEVVDQYYQYKTRLAPREVLDLVKLRLKTALRCGLFYLLRKSEFLPGLLTGQRASLRWCDVRCYTKSRQRLSWAQMVDPARVVHSMDILIAVSKTDLAQVGRLVPLDAFPAESLAACPVRAMMGFLRAGVAAGCILHEDQQVFDLTVARGDVPNISSHALQDVLDGVASRVGLDPTDGRLVPHSLRVGGATAMAAHGTPMMDLVHRGGWSERSARTIVRYAQATSATGRRAAAAFHGMWTRRHEGQRADEYEEDGGPDVGENEAAANEWYLEQTDIFE
jgi:hypothetical protein